jgi:SAM-dependent methyltransferase
MSQKTSGLRSILSLPGIYQVCQDLLGGTHARQEFIARYIRPKPNMRILDLGCGPASVLEYLPEYIHYVGADLSLEYIDAARKKYGNRGNFFCLSVDEIPEVVLEKYDLVMGIGVLHHLEDDQARGFFSTAAGALDDKDAGRCLTVDPCFVERQNPIARLLIRMDRGQNVRRADEYSALARDFFSSVNQEIRHDRLRLPYTHHIMECRI